MKDAVTCSNRLLISMLAVLAGISGPGCSLVLDVLDPDPNVLDGGLADGGRQDSGLTDGGTCHPQEPANTGACDAYWTSWRWNGDACEKVSYSGCGPNSALFETEQACEAAYQACNPSHGCDEDVVIDDPRTLCIRAQETKGFRWNGTACESYTHVGCVPLNLYNTRDACAADHAHCPRGDCQVAGCSGELCTDTAADAPCVWKTEFACYQQPFATCARQPSGTCGWTPNRELAECIDDGGPEDCRTRGCEKDTTCQPCWHTYACLPRGAVC